MLVRSSAGHSGSRTTYLLGRFRWAALLLALPGALGDALDMRGQVVLR